MRVGVPKEIKNHEYRAGLTPDSVRELVHRGHDVFVETGTGEAIGFTDDLYLNSGAEVVSSAAELFDVAELIIKVKEPQASEVELLTSKHTLFTYLHLAPDHDLTDSLIASGATCIAYETVTDEQGRLPLLAPMSEIAGRMAVQAGAHSLEMAAGGRGVLLSGAAGVPAAEVIILGGGVVGSNALAVAVGMGARVTVLDTSMNRLRELDSHYGNRINTVYSTRTALDEHLARADLVVGAVLLPGASAPKLIKHSHLHSMKRGSVIVDVAIDQGGCAETSHPTTHESPVFTEENIVHYCVANMPGAVARTSTLALNNATLPFILALANHGVKEALVADTNLLNGLNVYRGELVSPEVAASQNRSFTDRLRLLSRS
ncbi:L-alanine dehydrogenase [Thalassolituus maritimus]|jgi:alanine dehydrogenase|uniref:Alanine dehydrogenase n=1 Tax=Thalassolituus maritimus TaxID=484498 RepID=A0A1N7KXR3_9GAMM|nr:alanine dehydrogenase [Thalassolituus maritimus]SIS66373.1 L-alanine dehydrogenase [Thalassolituus maritimus]